MMTKTAMLTGLLVIAMLIAGGVYYATAKADTPSNQDLTALAARREDLIATQLQIEQQIVAINQSIQAAIAAQQTLSEQVKKLESQAGAGR